MLSQRDIERIYSDIITEHLNNGWMISPVTMNGSQGEIAAVDLVKTDGSEELIRILLHTKMVFTEHSFPVDAVVITVGRWKEPIRRRRPFDTFSMTIWNNRLEVLDERAFCQVAYEKDLYTEDVEESEAIERKRRGRKVYGPRIIPIYGAEKLALAYLKRVTRRRCIEEPEIKVEKWWDGEKNVYLVSYRGKDYRLH